MCDCEYAFRRPNGGFHCAKFGLYGWQGPLHICTMTRLQEAWNERMSRVPRQIVERERAYLGAACFDRYGK